MTDGLAAVVARERAAGRSLTAHASFSFPTTSRG